MSRRRINVEVAGSIFVIRGWQAHKLAREAGLRPTYNGVQGGWVADTKRLPDLVAYLGYRNVDVEIVDDSTPIEAQTPDRSSSEEELAPELDLFGGAW